MKPIPRLIDMKGNPIAKPETTKTILISYFTPGMRRGDAPQTHNIILPLTEFSLTHGDGWTVFQINYLVSKMNPLPQRIDRMVVCVCDDPFQTWAGDWSHLGTMRLRIELNRLVCMTEPLLTLKCQEYDCQTEYGDLIIPDRKVN